MFFILEPTYCEVQVSSGIKSMLNWATSGKNHARKLKSESIGGVLRIEYKDLMSITISTTLVTQDNFIVYHDNI